MAVHDLKDLGLQDPISDEIILPIAARELAIAVGITTGSILLASLLVSLGRWLVSRPRPAIHSTKSAQADGEDGEVYIDDAPPPPPSAWLRELSQAQSRKTVPEPEPHLLFPLFADPDPVRDARPQAAPSGPWSEPLPEPRQPARQHQGWDASLLAACKQHEASISSMDGLYASMDFRTHIANKLSREGKHKSVEQECLQDRIRKSTYSDLLRNDPDVFVGLLSRPVTDIKAYSCKAAPRWLLLLDHAASTGMLLAMLTLAMHPATHSALRACLPLAWLLALARAWARGHPTILGPMLGLYLVYDGNSMRDEQAMIHIDSDAASDSDEEYDVLHGGACSTTSSCRYGVLTQRRSGSSHGRSSSRRSRNMNAWRPARIQRVASQCQLAGAALVDTALTVCTVGVWPLLSMLLLLLWPGSRRGSLGQRLLATYVVHEKAEQTQLARWTAGSHVPKGK